MPRITDQRSDIYARHLLSQGRGYPLWTPEPSLELLDCRSDGHAIGDIGVVIPEDGRFEVFLNIRLPPTHPVNRGGVPRNFQTIALEDWHISTTANAEKPGCIIKSSHIKIEERSSWTRRQSELEYAFNLSRNEGSLLALPEGAVRSDLRFYDRFKTAIIQQGEDWCHFVKERVGRGYDSFYLVTGLHKTRSWSLAAFPKTEKTAECPARLKISQLWREDVTDATHWETRRDLESRTGPMSYGDLNQTAFVRGYTITMNTEKLCPDGPKITVKENILSTSTLRRPGSNGVASDTFDPCCLSCGLFTSRASRSSGRGIWDEPEDDNPRSSGENREEFVVGDDIVVEPMPELSPAFHPSDVINRYLLTKEPSANIAFTHDDDWIAMFEEDQLKLEDFAQNGRFETLISQKYNIFLKQGVVYLENQSHRGKDVDSNSASQPQHLGGSETNSIFFAEDDNQIVSGDTKGKNQRWRVDNGREVGEPIRTSPFLTVLQDHALDTLTYAEDRVRLDSPSSQTPRHIGFNNRQTLFDASLPAVRRFFYLVTARDRKTFIVDAGGAHGVSHGVVLTLCDQSGRGLTAVKVDQDATVEDFQTTVRVSEAHASLRDVSFAKLSCVAQVPIYLPARGNSHLALLEALRQMVAHGRDDANFLLVKDPNEARLEIAMQDKHIVFKILDHQTKRLGLTGIPCKATLDNLADVLKNASHFFWYLHHTKTHADTSQKVHVALHRLITRFDEDGGVYRVPSGQRLSRENPSDPSDIIIDFVVDPGEPYGITITNYTAKDLYFNALLFNSDLRVVPYYVQSTLGNPEPPLKRNKTFTIGYGPSGLLPLEFWLNEDQESDVSILKIFFATRPIDMTDVAQDSLLFPPLKADPPERKFDVARESGLHRRANDAQDIWFTKEIPIVQRKKHETRRHF